MGKIISVRFQYSVSDFSIISVNFYKSFINFHFSGFFDLITKDKTTLEILLAENPFISPTVNQAARSMAGYAKSIIRYEGILKRTEKLIQTNTEVYIKF